MVGVKLSDLTLKLLGKVLTEYNRTFKVWSPVGLGILRITGLNDIHRSFNDLGMAPGFRLGSVRLSTENAKLFVYRYAGGDESGIVYFEFYANRAYSKERDKQNLKKAEDEFNAAVSKILMDAGVGIEIDV